MVSVPEPSELETVQATTMLSISLVRLGIRNTDSSADQRLDRPAEREKEMLNMNETDQLTRIPVYRPFVAKFGWISFCLAD